MNPSSFTFWIDINQLMQRWSTNIVENVCEAVREGLPAYEEPYDVHLIGMEEIEADEFSDRYHSEGEYGVKPLRAVRFKTQDVIAFEQKHYGPWVIPLKEVIIWDIPSQKVLAEKLDVSVRIIRDWVKKGGLLQDDNKKRYSTALTAKWLRQTGRDKYLELLDK